jgi:hypothetical protein
VKRSIFLSNKIQQLDDGQNFNPRGSNLSKRRHGLK